MSVGGILLQLSVGNLVSNVFSLDLLFVYYIRIVKIICQLSLVETSEGQSAHLYRGINYSNKLNTIDNECYIRMIDRLSFLKETGHYTFWKVRLLVSNWRLQTVFKDISTITRYRDNGLYHEYRCTLMTRELSTNPNGSNLNLIKRVPL